MTKDEISNDSTHKRFHCASMCRTKNSGIFWGVLFIIVGFYWLGKIAGWFPPEIKMFWPIVLVFTGTWFVVSSLTETFRKPSKQ